MAVREFEAGDSEGYFASVSDLMVGILFIFLPMLTVFALNYQQEEEISREKWEQAMTELKLERARTRLAEERAAHLRELLKEAAAEVQKEIEDRVAARNRLLKKLERDLSKSGIPVRIDYDSGILHLQESVLFKPSEASVGPEQRQTVSKLGDALAQTLPCFTGAAEQRDCEKSELPILETVLIEGHTDKRPISNRRFRDNDQLSTERALAVFGELLLTKGLKELRNVDDSYPLLGVSGFGERRPLPEAKGDTETDYALNRRIDLRFILAARSSKELERLRSEIERALKEGEQ
jgi:chemotaxis protein MotB